MKEIKGDKDAEDEAAALNDWLKLNNEEADLKKRLKEAEAARSTAKHTPCIRSSLSRRSRALVVDDKWLASLDAAVLR